jgi:hypothetical protein
MVYILRPVGMLGPVKIGASCRPKDRLLTLAYWSPFPLEIVAAIPGNVQLESKIHKCLAEHHSHHEWFLPAAEVLAFVDAIVAGVPVEEAIDLDAPKGRLKRGKPGPVAKNRTLVDGAAT